MSDLIHLSNIYYAQGVPKLMLVINVRVLFRKFPLKGIRNYAKNEIVDENN